jgi:hypothetical protein
MAERIKALELSNDDRLCYVADADMKNEELTNQLDSLKALLSEMDTYLQQGLGPNHISTGSIFHRQIKQALES